MYLHFFVPGKPATAGSKKWVGRTKTGRPILVDMCKRGPSWRTKVKRACNEAMKTAGMTGTMHGSLDVFMSFIMERPQCHYYKMVLRKKAPPFPVVRPDLLKMARAVEDALTGVMYHDDSQIITERMIKRYVERPAYAQEGVYITVQEV